MDRPPVAESGIASVDDGATLAMRVIDLRPQAAPAGQSALGTLRATDIVVLDAGQATPTPVESAGIGVSRVSDGRPLDRITPVVRDRIRQVCGIDPLGSYPSAHNAIEELTRSLIASTEAGPGLSAPLMIGGPVTDPDRRWLPVGIDRRADPARLPDGTDPAFATATDFVEEPLTVVAPFWGVGSPFPIDVEAADALEPDGGPALLVHLRHEDVGSDPGTARRLLASAHRALAPGGILAVSTSTAGSATELMTALLDVTAGFVTLERFEVHDNAEGDHPLWATLVVRRLDRSTPSWSRPRADRRRIIGWQPEEEHLRIKLLDYLDHGRRIGFRTALVAHGRRVGDRVWAVDDGAVDDKSSGSTDHLSPDEVTIGPDDLVLYSSPDHRAELVRRLGPAGDTRRLIHLSQSTSDPPATAPGLTVVVGLDPAGGSPNIPGETLVRHIPPAHRYRPFVNRRTGGFTHPLTVGAVGGGSDLIAGLQSTLGDDPRYEFRCLDPTAPWTERRDLLRWCQVFVVTPDPTHRFDPHGLEALAADCIVMAPDVTAVESFAGNRSTVLEVVAGDLDDHLTTLDDLTRWTVAEVRAMRAVARSVLTAHEPDVECLAFREALVDLAAVVGPVAEPVASEATG